MTDLIKQVGGIGNAKDIVSGAPESNFPVKYGLNFKTYFRQVGYYVEQWFDGKWQTRYSDGDWICLESLRQAIADYNTDHCSDIGNHLSPSTKIINK